MNYLFLKCKPLIKLTRFQDLVHQQMCLHLVKISNCCSNPWKYKTSVYRVTAHGLMMNTEEKINSRTKNCYLQYIDRLQKYSCLSVCSVNILLLLFLFVLYYNIHILSILS